MTLYHVLEYAIVAIAVAASAGYVARKWVRRLSAPKPSKECENGACGSCVGCGSSVIAFPASRLRSRSTTFEETPNAEER